MWDGIVDTFTYLSVEHSLAVYLNTFYVLHSRISQPEIFSMFRMHLAIVYTNLIWVLDFLLYHLFYKFHVSQFTIVEEEGVCHYESTPGSEDVDCAVCLCKIEDEEEIRVLRCEHVFHRNCLDRWVSFKVATCPLCREQVRPRRSINEVGAQILFFEFCSIQSNDHDTWWLR
ncbi:hypothetical protein RJT34_07135 [Clitoria ternatea]|uniref:RING-type domain-containing protein n=1 Tax=Clitoria ternatea TaxID=43366 RepID=A0AAN9K2C7_CLITE